MWADKFKVTNIDNQTINQINFFHMLHPKPHPLKAGPTYVIFEAPLLKIAILYPRVFGFRALCLRFFKEGWGKGYLEAVFTDDFFS